MISDMTPLRQLDIELRRSFGPNQDHQLPAVCTVMQIINATNT
jgi:hypothetical protein